MDKLDTPEKKEEKPAENTQSGIRTTPIAAVPEDEPQVESSKESAHDEEPPEEREEEEEPREDEQQHFNRYNLLDANNRHFFF